MFRRIISNCAFKNAQSQRWQELAKFACLRASLETNSEKAFQELAKQNNIKPQELVEASKIISLNLDVLKQNINSEIFSYEKESTLRRYRESSVGSRGKLVDVHAATIAKYPNLGESLGKTAGYKEAYIALADIFINPSIAIHNLSAAGYGEKYAVDFKLKSEQYIKTLLKEHEKNPEAVKTIKEINQTLNTIIDNYTQNPSSIYARILTLLQTRCINAIATVEKGSVSIINIQTTSVPSLNIDDLTASIDEPVNSDLSFDADLAFIQEANLVIQQNAGNLPWEGDKRKIFQSTVGSYTEIPYYLLAVISGLGLAYFFYSGDAKYKTMILTPVVGIATLALFKRNQVFNRVPTLTQLLLHKDGKHVDAIISINGQIVTKSDIPISTIKLNRGDHNISLNLNSIEKANIRYFLSQTSGQENTINYNFSQIRKYTGRNGQILNLGDVEVLVTFNNIGNRIILKQIFKGIEVLPSA